LHSFSLARASRAITDNEVPTFDLVTAVQIVSAEVHASPVIQFACHREHEMALREEN
jgi:hypothetical protein